MANYISYICSPYHKWFIELGYPRLDINEYLDGEWSIIEYHQVPIVPAITNWHTVLSGMKNIIPTFGFVEKYTKSLDLTRKEIWDREDKKTQEMLDANDKYDQHVIESAEAKTKLIMKSETIKDRIARNGMSEAMPWNILKHVPTQKIKEFNKKDIGV